MPPERVFLWRFCWCCAYLPSCHNATQEVGDASRQCVWIIKHTGQPNKDTNQCTCSLIIIIAQLSPCRLGSLLETHAVFAADGQTHLFLDTILCHHTKWSTYNDQSKSRSYTDWSIELHKEKIKLSLTDHHRWRCVAPNPILISLLAVNGHFI